MPGNEKVRAQRRIETVALFLVAGFDRLLQKGQTIRPRLLPLRLTPDFVFGALLAHDPPQMLGRQQQLPHVGLIVIRLLVADAEDEFDRILFHHGHAHMADEVGVTDRIALPVGVVLIVVEDHRTLPARAIGPHPGLRKRIVLIVRRGALTQRLL